MLLVRQGEREEKGSGRNGVWSRSCEVVGRCLRAQVAAILRAVHTANGLKYATTCLYERGARAFGNSNCSGDGAAVRCVPLSSLQQRSSVGP